MSVMIGLSGVPLGAPVAGVSVPKTPVLFVEFPPGGVVLTLPELVLVTVVEGLVEGVVVGEFVSGSEVPGPRTRSFELLVTPYFSGTGLHPEAKTKLITLIQ
jgi:hypothetical protein